MVESHPGRDPEAAEDMTRNQCVVSVFGGSAPKPGDLAYRQGVALGKLLAEAGLAVATGGYIGTMEAVSKGAASANGRVIGMTCDQIETWRGVKPNAWVQEEVRSSTLRERLNRLVEIGDAWIALPGGIGTLSEVSLCWSLLQTREVGPRPLVLIGPMWKESMASFQQSGQGYLRRKDVDLLTFAPDEMVAVDHIVTWMKSNSM